MEGDVAKEKSALEIDREKKHLIRAKLLQLCACDDIVSTETVNAIGNVTGDVRAADDNAPSTDELDENLEEEYRDLNLNLDLPNETYSLVEFRPELPTCVKYGVRAGLTHMNLPKFSPLSRGHQGGAIAIAAFATTAVFKSRCWNEAVIDQIIEDGDTFYCESYRDINTDDRRLLSILDLKRDLFVQQKLNVNVSIEDPSYAGTFRSQDPKKMHLIRALDLFFKRYTSGILFSPVLTCAIWKDPRYYNIFDGQPRKENCEPAEEGEEGTAKLFLVKDMIGVLFIILEKSKVQNEPFVLYAIAISGVEPFSLADDPDEPEKSLGKPQRRPSGYRMLERFRAVVQGTYHMMHPSIPEPLRGRGHLVVSLAALIYSRLVNGNKWTSALIDLIFNQANIYLIDLVRVLEKKFDPDFELRVDDLMGDVILGAYSAKIKIRVNTIPGYGKKRGKVTIDGGIREFFDTNVTGILEIKKFYYAIWREDDTYYFLDPFACDDEGFRINFADTTRIKRLDIKEAACVTMNSSVNEMVETILENTGNKDRDPFFIHGVRVLYVKTGTTIGSLFEKVIYREKGTSRRPQPPQPVIQDSGADKIVDMTPKERPGLEKKFDNSTQYPELMRYVETYMKGDDEPDTFLRKRKIFKELMGEDEEDDDFDDRRSTALSTTSSMASDDRRSTAMSRRSMRSTRSSRTSRLSSMRDDDRRSTATSTRSSAASSIASSMFDEEEEGQEEEEEDTTPPLVVRLAAFNVVNPRRLVLQGTKNCLEPEFPLRSQGRQGLIAALSAISYRRLKNTPRWRNVDIDQIIDLSNKAYGEVIDWIKSGRPEIKLEEEKTEDEEEEEVEPAEDEELEKQPQPAPSHLDLSMLPIRIKIGENDVFFKWKMNIMGGNASPLANLAEALECYFSRYSELVLENKRLMFGIWKDSDKFFIFNPYGGDEEGWRIRNHPAALAVTDSLNELIDVLYGILEFNDPAFIIHFVGLDAIQPGKYFSPERIDVPEDDFESFNTSYLPITDDDLDNYENERISHMPPTEQEPTEPGVTLLEKAKDTDTEEDEDTDAGDEDDEDEKGVQALQDPPLVCALIEVPEKEQPDAPYRMNLALLTTRVKIRDRAEVVDDKKLHEEVVLEKLKFNHPPPYVMPPKKTLCTLLEAKKAKRSIHSLVSRFSIDSRLDVKKKGGFSAILLGSRSAVITSPVGADGSGVQSKLIKLSMKKYLYSRVLPICLMPMRAVNDRYIQDKDLIKQMAEEEEERMKPRRTDHLEEQEVPENPVGIRFMPELIPLGHIIRTPVPPKKVAGCPEKKKRKCAYVKGEDDDPTIERVLCNTEDVLFELLFPDFKVERKNGDANKDDQSGKEDQADKKTESTLRIKKTEQKTDGAPKEEIGFKINDDDVGVIQGNMCLDDRKTPEECHFKSCFFAAMLCILGKIRVNVDNFRGTYLDQFVLGGDKIYQRVGKLRHKISRYFEKIKVLDTLYSIVARQEVYADPANCQADEFEIKVENYLQKHSTGILVFPACSLAFWAANDRYYLFDPYASDEDGKPNEGGYAVLLEFCDLEAMLARIEESVGKATRKPFRIYSMNIAHMELKKKKKKKRRSSWRKKKQCIEKVTEQVATGKLPDMESVIEPESSLVELASWVLDEPRFDAEHDMSIPGFAPIQYYEASMLEVTVLVNDITTPVLAPFKKGFKVPERNAADIDTTKWRKYTYDKKFKEHTAVIMAFDLCVIAWSMIHDPITWSVRTVRGLYEASMDYANDSNLAAEDSTVSGMIDGLLPEFEIANYTFRAVTAPLHFGTLYSYEGWNLAMSLMKLFESNVYSGAILVCRDAHVGVTKRNDNYFAWWAVRRTKKVRIITCEEMPDFLRLITKEINVGDKESFVLRAITISYGIKMDPDCSDTKGLHEPVIPTTSLVHVHKKEPEPYDLEAIFRPVAPNPKPVFVHGTVALRDRDTLKEPHVKRCYFVGILAVMVKRDVIQSPMPGMIDKIIEVAEGVYREFQNPVFHTEHILRNVTLMNRIFDFVDSASQLVRLTVNIRTGRNDFYYQVRKHLRRHFKRYTCGIIHFTNCCYGFWYSRATNCYYYLDPYRCDVRGRKALTDGTACLCIFPTACQMAKHMCFNQHPDTTGFFIHRVHVNSINVPPFNKFQEDPMWVYLDYHWSFEHASELMKVRKSKKQQQQQQQEEEKNGATVKQYWNNYVIEVSNLIYSVWGTIGSYDSRFGDRAGKNQAAICVAVLAMQYLSHPSRWSPAILDSAVVCGDCYYTESLKSAAKQCARHFNRYNLQPVFRVFPHTWTINFRLNLCGILYGARNRMTLATSLNHAFEEAPNLLIECNKITLAALKADDGYYVADPCWIGPPLFERDCGAIYILRCRNMNALVYAVTKIFNTNQRLEFRITPLLFTFEKEDVKREGKSRKKKRILAEPIHTAPAKVNVSVPPIPGGQTVADHDCHVFYQNNIGLGTLKGHELENPKLPSVAPKLDSENLQNVLVSTTWHLNVGQTDPLKKPFDPSGIQHVPEDCFGRGQQSFDPTIKTKDSLVEMLALCDDYPRVVDFAGKVVDAIPKKPTKAGSGKDSVPVSLGCRDAVSFLRQDSRAEFHRWNEELADPIYKIYKHHVRGISDDSEVITFSESRRRLMAVASRHTIRTVKSYVGVNGSDAGSHLESGSHSEEDSQIVEGSRSEAGSKAGVTKTAEDPAVDETTAAETSPAEESPEET